MECFTDNHIQEGLRVEIVETTTETTYLNRRSYFPFLPHFKGKTITKIRALSDTQFTSLNPGTIPSTDDYSKAELILKDFKGEQITLPLHLLCTDGNSGVAAEFNISNIDFRNSYIRPNATIAGAPLLFPLEITYKNQ